MCLNGFKHLLVILSLINFVICWRVIFEPNKTIVTVGDHQKVQVILSELTEDLIKNFTNGENNLIEFKNDDENLVGIENDENSKWIQINESWMRNFTINGIFLGN